MKPTKEQIKIVFRKILFWQREQKNKEENNIFIKDKTEKEETLNDIAVLDNLQVENEKLTIKERYNQIPKSEKAKMMFLIENEQKSQEERNQTEIPAFNNEQMKLHLYDIGEVIKLKFSQESISTDGDLIITFKNQLISIEPSLVEFAFAYEELNNTYQLEAKMLIEEMISRFGDGYEHVPETLIVDFLKEILKQKKLQIEKEAFKRKIVWLKK
jgi:hypothetical protein